MTAPPDGTIRVRVDPSNPGQFFACCGLLELADRLWGGAEGWFEDGIFMLRPTASPARAVGLQGLLAAVAGAALDQLDLDDDCASPIRLGPPLEMNVDWWHDGASGGKALKVWAGSMRVVRIARAMQHVLGRPEVQTERLFDHSQIVYDPAEPDKKVEPFYFDARRGGAALPLDLGFAPDSLQMTSAAYPAVEFLCMVGLQRCRPAPTKKRRVFEYSTWGMPLEAPVVPAAAVGLLPRVPGQLYRFESAFRSDQRKHKAFRPATRMERREP